MLRAQLPLMLLVAPPLAAAHAAGDCARCAAVANELERQMHEEWSHLNLTKTDRKRNAARDAAQQHACNLAVSHMLDNICDAVKGYAVGDGGRYYQKINGANADGDDVIVITGSVSMGPSDKAVKLQAYCKDLLDKHEPSLAPLMADGTNDLITDLCISIAHECTADEVATIPAEGLPRHRARSMNSIGRPQ